MAHFAKVSLNSKVISVLTLNNADMLNADGVEDESVGQQYLERHNNWPAPMWIQTSNNIFYVKKPYASWVLNTTDAQWHSPIGEPPDLGAEATTHRYKWNESDKSWDKIANYT